jgi:hypothetical protein
MPEPVTHLQYARAVGLIVGAYLTGLFFLDLGHRNAYGDGSPADDKTMYVWDHPEPNFVWSNAITEFWSVLTTIPLAGALLCWLGLRYRLAFPVMAVYVLTFLMYNFAFTAHATLWKPVFQLTLTSVMLNCFTAFWLYGFLATDLTCYVPKLELLGCGQCRAKVAVPSVAMVAFAAVNLPDSIGENGGVWTLFYVQAPPVWLATIAAWSLLLGSSRDDLRPAYKMVSHGGLFLSLAMFLSYCECRLTTRSVINGFPALHVAIHVSEQIGIYMYGLSLAFLQQVHVQPRRGARFSWLFGCVPYFHCDALAQQS